MNGRGYYPHTLGGGVLLGLMVSERPLWIFAAGVVVGIGLTFAVRALRLVARIAQRLAGAGDVSDRSSARSLTGTAPASVLTTAERERAELEGRRQGEAAGIRAAARQEVRDAARHAAMQEALDARWQDERHRSVMRAVGGAL